jgi:hypothetical protein
MDPIGIHPKEAPTNPRTSLLMRLLEGEGVPPDTRSFETKYLHLTGALPFLIAGLVFLAGLIGYLIGSL